MKKILMKYICVTDENLNEIYICVTGENINKISQQNIYMSPEKILIKYLNKIYICHW